MATDRGEGIAEGEGSFGIPCRRVQGVCRRTSSQCSCASSVTTEKSPVRADVVRWMARSDRLALRLEAQVCPHLMEGHFELEAAG
jgi:hypothetical protein